MSCKHFTILLLLLSISSFAQARDHLIYSIEEELPMGFENETLKKNYYINMGSNQGVDKGTLLNVYRVISKLNPYNNQRRINHKIKVGKVKILHSSSESSIGILKELYNDKDESPLFDLEDFMIGDHVDVSVN